MKKLNFILVFLLILYNCSTNDHDSSDLIPETYKLNAVNIDGIDFQVSSANIDSNDLQFSGRLNSEGSEANGHFNSQEGHWKISFSSGDTGEFGNFVMHGLINVKADVICAVVVENRAVIQLVITHAWEMPEWAEEVFTVGYTLFFLLEDNGEGINAPRDRYWNYNLYTEETWDFCFDLDPDSFIEIFSIPGLPEDGEFFDTGKKSDQIQIQ